MNFHNIAAGEFSINGHVDGFWIPKDFVPLQKNVTISGQKKFVGHTDIIGDLSVNGRLSGMDFQEFYDNALKNNTDETIDGDVSFRHNVTVVNLTVLGKMNDLSLPDDVVTLNTYQNISNRITLTDDTTFKNDVMTYVTEVNKTVNGIDVSEMERHAIYKDRNQVGIFRKIFR